LEELKYTQRQILAKTLYEFVPYLGGIEIKCREHIQRTDRRRFVPYLGGIEINLASALDLITKKSLYRTLEELKSLRDDRH